ncbi:MULTISPECIES: alpha/beta fold hydrolase [unclassified Streptomyces]|uniref:alpha/beta fold hydrolase n=1 Tax=unclassified Streptomyces TaxID=2593676 RepID=UPI00093C65EE|nr:alpha/beta hydrolase [Streptomyces sp. TSRI0281]OKI32161.1 hydrolase [Streptomyces sp. TSRI0281]
MTPSLQDLPETVHLTAPGGRRIAYCSYGDPAAPPVIVLHGTPGSRFEGIALRRAATDAGLHLVCPDRPGYGETDPVPGRGFHRWNDDFVALLDHLGHKRAPLVAISGGGGYALAAAQAHPERVSKLILACAAVPGAPRQAYARRIPIVKWLNRLVRWAPLIARPMLAGTGIFKRTRSSGTHLSAWPLADQLIMKEAEFRKFSELDTTEGRRQGMDAAMADLAGYARPLPEPLGAIRVPTVFIHGEKDGNVPIDVARWAHAQIDGAELRPIPDGGHLFLLMDADPLLRELA